MKKKSILALITAFLLWTAFTVTPNTVQAATPIILHKWSNPMPVNDAVVSLDGNYVAAVNYSGLYFFSSADPNPLWSYEPGVTLLSVAISVDGDFVIAGDNNGYLHYFNQSTSRNGEQLAPTWQSYDMGGPIEKGTMDMSANGNYTVVGGTGVNTWYYANCHKRSNMSEIATWISAPGVYDFLSVHISADGKHVAGGGSRYGGGFVTFFTNATTKTGYISPTWYAYSQLGSSIIDVALSDDGYAVAAITSTITSLHYWANASNLTEDPNATWTDPSNFGSIDMSGDGDSLIAAGIALLSLHFWGNCRVREGVQTEDWVRLEDTSVTDEAISKDGNIIVASAQTGPSNHTAYFLTSNGTIINDYPLNQYSPITSISATGNTIAVAGPGYDSLHVFTATLDITPPYINEVTQQPSADNVTPTDEVKVFANITDNETGVKLVTLNYTTGNGTWFTQTMTPYQTDIWNGTIPPLPYCNTIMYVIIAEDNANNTRTTLDLAIQLQYHVIPEYVVLSPLFISSTLMVVLAYKKTKKENS